MKMQYSLFLVMLLGLLGFNASAMQVTVTVEGDGPVLWGDSQTSMTNELAVGEHVVDWSGNIYFTTPEGYTLDPPILNGDGYSSPIVIEPLSTNERIFNRAFSGKDRNFKLHLVTKASAQAVGVTFILENGSASIYRQNDTYGDPAVFVQDLTPGQETTVPTISGRRYYIVAGEGLDLDVTNSAGVAQYTYDDDYEFYRYVSPIDAWNVETYTITTKTAPVKQDFYDVTFNIKGGESVELRQYDYTTLPMTVTKETITNGQTKTFPAGQSWSVYPIGDYGFAKVTDGDGQDVELMKYSSPYYFMINTTTPPVPSVINVEYDVPAEYVTFNLENGSASIYYPAARDANGNQLPPEKVQDLVVGENHLSIISGKYYVIVAGEGLTMTVVNDNTGSDVWTNDAQYGTYGGDFAQVPGWEKGSFTITTKAAPIKKDSYDVTFNITGGQSITLTHRDYSGGFPPVVETQTVTNGQTLNFPANDSWECTAPENYELISVVNADGEAQQIIKFSEPHYFQLNTFDVPSDSYTFTLKSTIPDGVILNLENGSASIYYPAGYDENRNPIAPEKVQDLTVGQNLLPLVNGKSYVIVAGEGLTMTVVNDKTGADVWINDAQYGDYGGDFAQVNGWENGSFTIKTKPAPIKKDSYDVTFYINGGSAINLTHRDYSGGFPPVVDVQTVTNGQTLNFSANDSWECTAPAGSTLVSVTNADGEKQQIITFSEPHYFQLNTYDVPSDSYTFELYTEISEDDYFIVDVDNASLVSIVDADNESVTLENGRNLLTPAVAYTVKPLGTKPFKSITLNEENLEATDGVYNLSATQTAAGNVLNIVAVHPIVYTDVTVNIDGDANVLTAYSGDASSASSFTEISGLKAGANTVKVQEGFSIRFATKNGGVINTVSYKVDANAEATDAVAAADGSFLAGPFAQGGEVNVVMGETQVPQINFTLTVNDPSAISVKYYNDNGVLVNLPITEEVNHLSVPKSENYQFVQMRVAGISAANDIKSVKYRKSADLNWSYAALASNNTYDVYVYFGYDNEIEVEVNHLDIDKTCTVFTDYGVNHGVKLVSAQGREVSLSAGYQDFEFGESENPFKVVVSNASATAKVFVDGEMIEGTEVTLTEGSLVKIFTGSIETLSFSFDIKAKKDEVEGFKVTDMMIDGRTPVEDPTKPIDVLYGTEVTFAIEAPEDVTYTVKYNDDSLQPDDNGVYSLWVRDNSTAEITYTYTNPNPPVEETILYLVGEVSGNDMKPEFKLTEGESGWTLSIAELSGKFRIKSEDGKINLGSNGKAVELNKPYTPAEGATADMELACGSLTDVTITVDKDGYTITVNGTVGIAAISRDALDANAIYFDLQGRRISTENVANGIYIQVANGQARKIAVK